MPSNGDDVIINNGHTITFGLNTAAVNTLTINAGGTLTGANGSNKPLIVGNGSGGIDLTNNGTISFQTTVAGTSVSRNIIKLQNSSKWAGSGTWDLYSIDLNNRALTFDTSAPMTVSVSAAAPFAHQNTITTPSNVTWNFDGLGPQTIPLANFTHGGLQTGGSGSKTVASGNLTLSGSLTIGVGTTFDAAANNPTVTLAGNLTNYGSFNAGIGTYTFNGSSAQSVGGPSSALSFKNLVLNNGAGLTTSLDLGVSGVLTLTSGTLSTSGSAVVNPTASCLTSVFRAGGWVAGLLKKTIPTGSPTCLFEVGDASVYRPISGVSFTSVTAPFSVTGSVSQSSGKHPAIGSSRLSPTRGVNRYWTLTNNGPGSPFANYGAVFNFVAGDLDAGVLTADLLWSRYSSGTWSTPATGTQTSTSTQVNGQTSFGDFAIGSPITVDHYELSLATSSLSCLPTTVTVTACQNSAAPCTSPVTSLAGQTLSLSTSGATLGATTLTFDATGVVTTTLSYPTAADNTGVAVTLSGEQTAASNARQCCPNGNSCSAANSCTSTYRSAGFIVSGTANGSAVTLPAQTAGIASAIYYLRAVKTNTTTKACEAALSGAQTVNWSLQCNNPTTCSTGTATSLMSLDGGNPTSVLGNPNSNVTGSTPVAMTFDPNGNAPFSFTFGDVGLVTLRASKTVAGAALSGASSAFVTKPASLAITNLKQTASPFLVNPLPTSATDAKFVRAGESFTATVTALTSSGAATPNFGKETTPEAVLLTPTLVLPAGGVAGTLANASLAGTSFAGGSATVSNLSYNEVGIITVTPSLADGDYLGAGSVTGSVSGNLGRFYPDRFVMTPGIPVPACSGVFSYFGQDGFTTPFTLTAMNTSNAVTQNYSGSFARLALTNWSGFGFSSSGLPSGATLSAGATAPVGSWMLGVANVSARHQVSRPSALTATTNVIVNALPVDSDGVSLSAATAVGTSTPLRWGRLRVSNAFGNANASLQVPVIAEYWSGNAWVLNSADSCTTLAASSVALSNPRDAVGNTTATFTSAGAVALSTGSGLLTLAAPNPASRTLSIDLAINLGSTAADQSCLTNHPASTGAAKPWLRGQNGACATTADRDPAARASFGIFTPESKKIVHVREIF